MRWKPLLLGHAKCATDFLHGLLMINFWSVISTMIIDLQCIQLFRGTSSSSKLIFLRVYGIGAARTHHIHRERRKNTMLSFMYVLSQKMDTTEEPLPTLSCTWRAPCGKFPSSRKRRDVLIFYHLIESFTTQSAQCSMCAVLYNSVGWGLGSLFKTSHNAKWQQWKVTALSSFRYNTWN